MTLLQETPIKIRSFRAGGVGWQGGGGRVSGIPKNILQYTKNYAKTLVKYQN